MPESWVWDPRVLSKQSDRMSTGSHFHSLTTGGAGFINPSGWEPISEFHCPNRTRIEIHDGTSEAVQVPAWTSTHEFWPYGCL
jgi:hypothetical protein